MIHLVKANSAFTVFLIVLVFLGCNSSHHQFPITTSIDQLHGESSDQVFRDSQIRLVSIAGLLPDANVALSNWYRKEKTGMASVARNAVSAKLGDGDYILRTEIPSSSTLKELVVIQETIQTIYHYTAKAIGKTIDKSFYMSATSKETDAASIEGLKTKIAEIDKEIDELNEKLLKLNTILMKAVAANGDIVILNWETQQVSDAGISLSSLFQSKAASQKKTTGYAILSGIRLSQIMLGDTSISILNKESPGKYFYMNSVVMQARKILYSASLDMQSEIMANLDIDVKNLESIESFLSEGSKLKINYYINQLTNLSNRGCLTENTWKLIPIPDSQDVKELIADSAGWKTIYVLKTRRRDLSIWWDDDK